MRTPFSIVLGLTVAAVVARAASDTAPPLHAVRYGHAAAALADGRVVILGGEDGAEPLGTSEIYDAASGAWTSGAELPGPRTSPAATLLADGRVLVTGGRSTESAVPDAQVYDAGRGLSTAVAPLRTPRFDHTATLLDDGTVLVTGGFAGDEKGGPVPVATSEIYDPASDRWTVAAPMLRARAGHTATRLIDGRVLVVGGYGDDGGDAMRTAELFDPITGSWTASAAPALPRTEHTATLLADGRALVAGGYDQDGDARPDAELFDPAIGAWTATTAIAVPRAAHSATLLASGDVLIAGGWDGAAGLNTTEIWRVPIAARPTVTRITAASPASSRFGQLVTLTARVAAVDGSRVDGGAVEFFDRGVSLGKPVTLGGGQASLATAAISTANRLTAVYRPDGRFAASTSEVFPYAIAKAVATSTLTFSRSPQQYSDPETFEATMSPAVAAQPFAGTVTFKVGTQEMGTAPLQLEGNVYKARLTTALLERVPGQLQPTTPTGRMATAVINAPDFQVANAMRALVITKEDARVTYDGMRFAVTAGSKATDAAAVTLRATIRDIAAADPGQDASPGDIRGAFAQFYNRETGLAISPALPVALVKPDDTTTGFVSYTWVPTIGTANSQTFRVGVMLGTYYLRNCNAEDALITVSKPPFAGFVTGGGAVTLASSIGMKPGNAGSEMSFGLGVKYTGTGSSPAGQFATMVRSGAAVYQVKSVAVSSSTVSGTAATLRGTASIYDVTTGLLLVDAKGRFEVTLTGATAAITVWNGAGAVWFASAPGSAPQNLAAGQIIVR